MMANGNRSRKIIMTRTKSGAPGRVGLAAGT
jgi:hypothetical protein